MQVVDLPGLMVDEVELGFVIAEVNRYVHGTVRIRTHIMMGE
jgi:ferric-dicitrate binding protein FerR (iron transport regulator)